MGTTLKRIGGACGAFIAWSIGIGIIWSILLPENTDEETALTVMGKGGLVAAIVAWEMVGQPERRTEQTSDVGMASPTLVLASCARVGLGRL